MDPGKWLVFSQIHFLIWFYGVAASMLVPKESAQDGHEQHEVKLEKAELLFSMVVAV